jgi:glucuronoarabinoxylan endo-1,4-beta-xylanase
VRNICLHSVILASVLLTWGCGGSAGGAGTPGTGGSSATGTGGTTAVTGGSGSGGFGTGGSSGTGAGGTSPSGSGGSATGGPGGMGTGGTSVAGSGGSTGTGAVTVTVQLDKTEQKMDGFGINDSWATAFTDAQADQVFDPAKGIGLSILRIGMGSDGNPLSANIWGDIGKAKARGVTTFIASVWSAPANCKSNNSVNDGGHLNTGCYDSWATTIAAFPGKVKSNANVDLYAMSPANEPEFASCGTAKPCNGNYPTMLFTADEAVAFIKVVGPKLHALSPAVKAMTPEPSEWIHLWTNNSAAGSTNPLSGKGYDYGHALSKDTTAWAQVDIVGVHQYDTQVAEPWPSDVPQTKPLWQTEMSGVKWWPEEGPSSDINNGVVVAGWIHDAIVNGPASAWLWWWYQASSTDDNEGLLLKNGTVTKRLYTLGNFSKFIRPGYMRVDIAGNISTGVLLTAYKGTDGTVVIVAINKGTSSVTVPISISGGTAPAALTPWVTSASDNLVSKTAVTVSGGSFTATLAATTVTTFVGK